MLGSIVVASFFSSKACLGGDPPNIVVILADDLGWGDVGWHESEIPTPNLDKLAAQGARLEQFYVQPVCTPTRAAFLTGRYPIRHGLQTGVVRPWAQYGLPLDEQTLPEGLRSAGYATAIVGKWHLGHFEPTYLPTQRGFDHQYGHYNGAIDYYSHTRDGGLDWHKDDSVLREDGYSTNLIAKEASRLIGEYANKKPLFLYVPFNAVHSPHQAPDRYQASFDHLKGLRKVYAGMLAALDEGVGEIVEAVDQAGIRDNTIFIFSSDNGGPQPGVVTSNGSLRAGKGTHYEGGVRVPAFITWNGKIPAGSVVDAPLHIADLYPTLLQVAGAKVDQKLPLDGFDVWETITSGKPSPRKEVLINATPYSGAIRHENWKLVVNGGRATAGFDGEAVLESGDSKLELFDLSKDPNEVNDLSSTHADVTQRLFARWNAYREQAVPPKSKPKAPGFVSPKVWGESDGPAAAIQPVGLVPNFETLDDQGNIWKSREEFGQGIVVVYFYPADFTGGCIKQACAYRDRYAEFAKRDVKVVGISGDSVDNHRAFKETHGLNFKLLADPDGAIAKAFGVPVTEEAKSVKANVNNQELLLTRSATAKRWPFIVDASGNILYKNSEVSAESDADQILDLLSIWNP